MYNKKLYDDKELFEEICGSLERIGGKIEIIDRFHNLFKIVIAPELKDQAHLVIQETIDDFAIRRAKVRQEDPFTGVKVFLREIQGEI